MKSNPFSEKALTEKASNFIEQAELSGLKSYHTGKKIYKTGYYQCKEDLREWLEGATPLPELQKLEASPPQYKYGFIDGYTTFVKELLALLAEER